MYFLPLKISSLFFLSRPQHHRLNVLVSRSSSSGASRTCVVPINTGSSPHPAESATVLGGRRPGASAPHIRRETRNSCERTTREDTKLQRRSALLRTVSHTCRVRTGSPGPAIRPRTHIHCSPGELQFDNSTNRKFSKYMAQCTGRHWLLE